MGGADLQCRRGAAEPGQSLLDASPAGHPATEGARPGGLWNAAARGAYTDCVLSVLVLRAHVALSAAGEVGTTEGGFVGLGGVSADRGRPQRTDWCVDCSVGTCLTV